MLKEEFIKACNEHNLVLNDVQINNLDKYLSLIQEYNKVMNLTSIVEESEAYEKHFYDSLLFSFETNLNNKTLIDIGTGAGFPGVVIAICYPTCQVTLLEPLTKRCNFLKVVVDTLHLDNVIIINERSEDYSKKNTEKYDFATARAVSRLNILLEISSQLVKINGYFIALKGKIALEEVEEAKNALKELGFSVDKIQETSLPSEDALRYNLFIKKIKKTNPKYPRNYSQIKGRPL